VLVPQTHEHIGDKLNKKGIDWAWYAGAWQATLEQFKDSGGIPKIPTSSTTTSRSTTSSAWARKSPGTRAAPARRGAGRRSATNRFFADARAGKLPPVTFYKPQGNLNLHAGYADIASGDRHIAHAVKHLQESPQWKNMVVVITVDENGGWWDTWRRPRATAGGRARVPALVVSPFARKGTVDHTVYDTGSILRLITRVFDLETLDGLKRRDEAMRARGQTPMGDLTAALHLGAQRGALLADLSAYGLVRRAAATQVLAVARVRAVPRAADLDRLLAGEWPQPLQPGCSAADILRDLRRDGVAVDPPEHHDELVAAQARHQIAGAPPAGAPPPRSAPGRRHRP
jgi:hypothetical protein